MNLISKILNRPQQTDNSAQLLDGHQPDEAEQEALVRELLLAGCDDDE